MLSPQFWTSSSQMQLTQEVQGATQLLPEIVLHGQRSHFSKLRRGFLMITLPLKKEYGNTSYFSLFIILA